MDILFIILIALCLWGAKVSVDGHPDYIDREQTTAVKGIFAVLILFSHSRGYLAPETLGDLSRISVILLNKLGQLVVVMFLLYSGYVIMEALKRDRRRYTDTFLRRRLLRVWLMFAIAVGLYFCLNLAIGKEYPLHHILLSFTGWTSIGNSNWFMFVILALYLLTYAALLTADRLGWSLRRLVPIVYLLTFGLLASLVAAGKGTYWYDTMLAYPTGMLYSAYKAEIERALRGWRWLAATVAVAGLFAVCNAANGWPHTLLASSFFALLLVMLTMKLRIHNRALNWLGVNAFAIYILQRLAMILCARAGLNADALTFFAAVIPATLLIAAVYTAATNRLLAFK